MSDSFSVHFVFETAPSAVAVTEAVGRWSDAGLLSAGVGATGGVDPATADDAAVAAALLDDDGLSTSVDAGVGDVRGSLRSEPTGLSPPDAEDRFEGARDLPHATLRVSDGYFYPSGDEHEGGEPEAAVRARTEDVLALVADLHEGLAAARVRPTHVYAPHLGREQQL